MQSQNLAICCSRLRLTNKVSASIHMIVVERMASASNLLSACNNPMQYVDTCLYAFFRKCVFLDFKSVSDQILCNHNYILLVPTLIQYEAKFLVD